MLIQSHEILHYGINLELVFKCYNSVAIEVFEDAYCIKSNNFINSKNDNFNKSTRDLDSHVDMK